MLPTLPQQFRLGQRLKIYESSQIEFKENSISLEKMKKTVCAFLNTIGGYILIGVDDSCYVVGIDQKVADRLALFVDQIIREAMVVRDDDAMLDLKEVSCDLLPIDGTEDVILMVRVAPEANTEYKWRNGERYYRLNASNYCRRDAAAEVEQLKESVVQLKEEKGFIMSQLRTAMGSLRKALVAAARATEEKHETLALFLQILRQKEEAERRLETDCCCWPV